MQIIKQPYVLNAFAGTVADAATNAGYLTIASTTTTVPRMYYPGGSAVLLKSQIETLSSWLVTATVANSTAYSFSITQKNLTTGINNTVNVFYNSDATATDAEIATGLSNFINAMVTAGTLHVAVSGAAISTGITIVGLTLFAPVTVTAGTNTTVANNLSVANVSSTNATPIVMTTAATTYAVGQVVVISGHTVNTSANGTWRVRATNGTTTVTLEALDGTSSVGVGVGGATGTTVKQASLGIGSYAQVNAITTSNQGTTGAPISPDTYTVLIFNGADKDAPRMTTKVNTEYQQTIYFDEAGANYAAMLAGLRNILNGLVFAGGAADPELLAVA